MCDVGEYIAVNTIDYGILPAMATAALAGNESTKIIALPEPGSPVSLLAGTAFLLIARRRRTA